MAALFTRRPFRDRFAKPQHSPSPTGLILPNLDVSNKSFENLLDQLAEYQCPSPVSDIDDGVETSYNRPVVQTQIRSTYSNALTTSINTSGATTFTRTSKSLAVMRNDSTGSSNYSHSKGQFDSPKVSRSSSQTTISQHHDETSLPSDKFLDDRDAIPAPGEQTSSIPTQSRNASSSSSQQTQTIQTSIMVISLPPDMNKPLPPNPSTVISYSEAQLPQHSRIVFEADSIPLFTQPGQQVDSNRRRSASAGALYPCFVDSVVELPGTSPQTSRAVRLGRYIASNAGRAQIRPVTTFDCGEKRNEQRIHNANSTPHLLPPISLRTRSLSTTRLEQLPDDLISCVLLQVDEIRDLMSITLASRKIMTVFKKHETQIVSPLIYKHSAAAWEACWSFLDLKNLKDFTLQHYLNSARVVRNLKRLIANRCEPMCKPDTLRNLADFCSVGKNDPELALWRIWTFSNLFGRKSGDAAAPVTEIDWLTCVSMAPCKKYGFKFTKAPEKAYSMGQLEDISEMWLCLQSLLSCFVGREREAREAGVFHNLELASRAADAHYLQEWTAYVLTQGLPVIMQLSSGSFRRVKRLGLTQWELLPLGQTHSLFLIAPVSKIYEEQVLAEARVKAAQIKLPPGPLHRPPSSSTQSRDTTVAYHHRPRPSSNQAISQDGSRFKHFPTSPSNDPTIFYALPNTTNASTKLGANLFPVSYGSTTSIPSLPSETQLAPQPAVVDPIDMAMSKLVLELGFLEVDARRALAMSDTGSGVDLEQAIRLLNGDEKPTRSIASDQSSTRMSYDIGTGGNRRQNTTPVSIELPARSPRRSIVSPDFTLLDLEPTQTIEAFHPAFMNPTGYVSPVIDPAWHDNKSTDRSKSWKGLGISETSKQIKRRASESRFRPSFSRGTSVRVAAMAVRKGVAKNLNGLGLVGVNFGPITSRS